MSKRVSTSTEYRRRKKKLVLAYSGVKQEFQDELQGHNDKSDWESDNNTEPDSNELQGHNDISDLESENNTEPDSNELQGHNDRSDWESDNNTEPDSNFLQEQDGKGSYREVLTGNDEVDCNMEEKKFQSLSPPKVNVLQGSDGEVNCHNMEDDMQSFEVHDDILSSVTSDEEESEDSDYHDCSDLEVLFLNENMDMQDGDDPPFPGDPESDLETSSSSDDGSSDPDDPSSPSSAASFSSSSSSSSSSDEDSDNEPFFNFNNKPALNRAVHFNRYRTVREGLLIFLALASANKWTYKSLIDTLKAENILLGSVLFPTCTKGLWRLLSHSGQGVTKFAYCPVCARYLGRYDNVPNNEEKRCITCRRNIPKSQLKWFISVSIKKQLLHLVSIPEMREHLQYRYTRVKINVDAYEDIFDGSAFLELQAANGVLSSNFNFSYVINLDGLRLGKNPKAEAWPLLLRLMDLPPKIRQKHTILGGIWIDTKPPAMNTFLRPFVKQCNKLSQEGFVWKPDGVNNVTSKFVPLCLCVDYKARFPMLNMVQYNSHHGCFICDHRGVYAGGSMRYPSQPHPAVPPPQIRTNENCRADMIAAAQAREPVRGFRGISRLLFLQHYRIATGNVIDNLHAIFERVAPAHTELLLHLGNMPVAEKVRRINARFLQAKPPSKISRTPFDFGKRGSYKASEWRNWVFHYSVPCLEGLRIPRPQLDHWQQFSYATFLLTQDSITAEEVDLAERILQRYVEQYEEFYGLEEVTPCVHLMTHLASIVRLWGPLHCYSMFYFESYNQKILSRVTSPKGSLIQIATRHLMEQHVISATYHQNGISNDIRDYIVLLMSKNKHLRRTDIDGVHLLGNPLQRCPSPQELECLTREGHQCDGIQEFQRVIIGSCEFHSARVNRQKLHDNTVIFTKQDTFCICSAIVIISAQGRPDFCGMFVTELDVLPLQEAPHICRVRPEGNLHHFIRIGEVRCPAVRHQVLGVTYVSPLPNGLEID